MRLTEHRQLLLGTFAFHRHNAMIVERKDVELPRVGADEASLQLRVRGVLHEFDEGQSGISSVSLRSKNARPALPGWMKSR